MITQNDFQTIITSKKKFFDINIKEIFKYKDLIFLFVRRDFLASFKQTILGPLWAIINPLCTTFVFAFIFGHVANLPSLDVKGNYILPHFIFYLSGTICWNYFQKVVYETSTTFLRNCGMMGKVYYPRLVSPIASTFMHFISFFIQLVFLAFIWIYYYIKGNTSITLTPNILLLPLVILQMMLLGMGVGIIITSITTKYRDMAMLVSFTLQIWQYFCPIPYGLTMIANKGENLLRLYMLNPFVSIITTFRYSIFGFGFFELKYFLLSYFITIMIFILGVLVFNKTEKDFIDVI